MQNKANCHWWLNVREIFSKYHGNRHCLCVILSCSSRESSMSCSGGPFLPHTSFAIHNCLLEMAKVGFSGGKGGRMKAKAPSHIPEHRCWAESWRRWRFRTSCVPLSCSTFSSSSTRACLCLLLCLSDSTWTFSHSLTDMTVDERKAVSHSVPCEGRTCTFILPHSALETILFER